MSSDHLAPVGVFDSGVGGLSVLRALREALPSEDFVYLADSAHAPYGDQEPEFIETRAIAALEFLQTLGTKAVVIACNTATAVAVHRLRARFAFPIVAIEPAIKPAIALSAKKIVGVMATRRTLESPALARLCRLHGTDGRIILQPCPGLVEKVEAGDLAGEATRALLSQYVNPLLAEGADTLVLGCTHFPFLMPLIRPLAGPRTHIVEPSVAVAAQLKRVIATRLGAPGPTRPGTEAFFTTGNASLVHSVIASLWHRPASVSGLSI